MLSATFAKPVIHAQKYIAIHGANHAHFRCSRCHAAHFRGGFATLFAATKSIGIAGAPLVVATAPATSSMDCDVDGSSAAALCGFVGARAHAATSPRERSPFSTAAWSASGSKGVGDGTEGQRGRSKLPHAHRSGTGPFRCSPAVE